MGHHKFPYPMAYLSCRHSYCFLVCLGSPKKYVHSDGVRLNEAYKVITLRGLASPMDITGARDSKSSLQTALSLNNDVASLS